MPARISSGVGTLLMSILKHSISSIQNNNTHKLEGTFKLGRVCVCVTMMLRCTNGGVIDVGKQGLVIVIKQVHSSAYQIEALGTFVLLSLFVFDQTYH